MSSMISFLRGQVDGVVNAVKYGLTHLDQFSTAGDVIVIQHADGTLHSTSFNVRFGKLSVPRPGNKVVQIQVNGHLVSAVMKLRPDGTAYFVESTAPPSSSLGGGGGGAGGRTLSPTISPPRSPQSPRSPLTPNGNQHVGAPQNPPPLSLASSTATAAAAGATINDEAEQQELLLRQQHEAEEQEAAKHIVVDEGSAVEFAKKNPEIRDLVKSLVGESANNSANNSTNPSMADQRQQGDGALLPSDVAAFPSASSGDSRADSGVLPNNNSGVLSAGVGGGLRLSRFASKDNLAAFNSLMDNDSNFAAIMKELPPDGDDDYDDGSSSGIKLTTPPQPQPMLTLAASAATLSPGSASPTRSTPDQQLQATTNNGSASAQTTTTDALADRELDATASTRAGDVNSPHPDPPSGYQQLSTDAIVQQQQQQQQQQPPPLRPSGNSQQVIIDDDYDYDSSDYDDDFQYRKTSSTTAQQLLEATNNNKGVVSSTLATAATTLVEGSDLVVDTNNNTSASVADENNNSNNNTVMNDASGAAAESSSAPGAVLIDDLNMVGAYTNSNNSQSPVGFHVEGEFGRRPHVRTTTTPGHNELVKLGLVDGMNTVKFIVYSTTLARSTEIEARIFLWPYTAKVIVSDIDGTVTKSDIMGHLSAMLRWDWTHPGLCSLYTNIAKNGYVFIYLTARSLCQTSSTRSFLENIVQDGQRLPDGPVFTSEQKLFAAAVQEVMKRSHIFKTQALTEVKAAFPKSLRAPLYAGFGNRIGDSIAYEAVGIPLHKIFIIDESSVVHVCKVKHSYRDLAHLVDMTFPPVAGKIAQFASQLPIKYSQVQVSNGQVVMRCVSPTSSCGGSSVASFPSTTATGAGGGGGGGVAIAPASPLNNVQQNHNNNNNPTASSATSSIGGAQQQQQHRDPSAAFLGGGGGGGGGGSPDHTIIGISNNGQHSNDVSAPSTIGGGPSATSISSLSPGGGGGGNSNNTNLASTASSVAVGGPDSRPRSPSMDHAGATHGGAPLPPPISMTNNNNNNSSNNNNPLESSVVNVAMDETDTMEERVDFNDFNFWRVDPTSVLSGSDKGKKGGEEKKGEAEAAAAAAASVTTSSSSTAAVVDVADVGAATSGVVTTTTGDLLTAPAATSTSSSGRVSPSAAAAAATAGTDAAGAGGGGGEQPAGQEQPPSSSGGGGGGFLSGIFGFGRKS